MEIQKRNNGLIIPPTPDFDIGKTLECGQVFRFVKNSQDDYTVYSADKSCRVYETLGGIMLETDEPDYFYSYFDLDTDYNEIYKALLRFDELSGFLPLSRGIRILRQDLFETIVSFIISANNNIPRIKGIIERLCQRFGQKKDGYYAFVTKEDFKDITAENFRQIGAGFRADYLYKSGKIITGSSYLSFLSGLDAASAFTELKKLKGVGDKVASCILLFGLKKTGSYPVDTWIFKAGRTDGLNTPQLVRRYYENRYGELAGYAQQYVFYAARNLKSSYKA